MNGNQAAQGGSPSPEEELPSGLSDRALLRQFQEGEDDAATAIYLRYARRLLRLAESQTGGELALRVDPEDVVQSVFRTFFRRAALGHYDIPAGAELWKLFLVIALNKIRASGNYHRAAKRSVQRTREFVEGDPAPGSPDAADSQAYNVLRLTIDDLLSELSEAQRKIVLLRVDGYEVADISRSVGRSKRTVERVLQRFRESLAEKLSDE